MSGSAASPGRTPTRNLSGGDLGGLNSTTLTIAPASETPGDYDYRVQVTDDVKTTNSLPGAISFNTHTQITGQPEGQTVQPGGTAQFSVAATGGLGGLTYQWVWEKNDGTKAFVPVTSSNASGADTPTLTITNVSDADAGTYAVQITDAGSTISATADAVQSNGAVLTVSAGVPVAGGAGLALLALATAVAGAAGLRRKK